MAGLDGEGGRWDEFDIAAEAFQEMVEEQKESLKGVLEEEVMELNQVRRKCLFASLGTKILHGVCSLYARKDVDVVDCESET